MPRILTILIFFFLTIHSAIAQVNVDSLVKLLDTKKDDTSRAKLLNKISEAYRFRDYEKMLDYARQAFELSEAHNYPNGKAYAHKFIGLANLDQSKYAVAIKNFEEAEQFFIASKDDIGLSSVLNNKGAAYSNLGDDTKALE